MEILAPFDTAQEVAPLIQAGVTELYCGFRDEFWRKRAAFTSIKVGTYGNIASFDELKESVSIAKKYNVPIFFCANMHVAEGAFQRVLSDIEKAIALGVQGVVVVDLSVVPLIRQLSPTCKIILSSKEPSLNREHILFFKELGVDSIFVSPRNMNQYEIEELLCDAEAVGLEIELFINDIGCRNITSMCQYRCIGMRSFYKTPIKLWLRVKKEFLRIMAKIIPIRVRNKMYGEYFYPYEIFSYPCHDDYAVKLFKNGKLEKEVASMTPKEVFRLPYCGLCDVYFFKNFRMRSIKLAGRGTPLKKKVQAVALTKAYLTGIESGEIDDSNFLEKGQAIYKAIFGKKCDMKQCYRAKSYKERATNG